MLNKIDMFTISGDDGLEVSLKEKKEADGIFIYKFELRWQKENAEKISEYMFSWFTPMIDIMYRWNTALKNDRHLSRNYDPYTDSMISKNAPIDAFYDGKGR